MDTGLTIRSYIVDCKVAYAKELLNAGKSVTDVAYRQALIIIQTLLGY